MTNRCFPLLHKPLKDQIISFNNRVLNDETIHDLLDVSFGYRLIGACGLDSARVITGQFGAHIHTNAKPWDIAAQFFICTRTWFKDDRLPPTAHRFCSWWSIYY